MFSELGTYLGSANTRAQILTDLGQHVYLALLPLVIGIVLALIIGAFAHRAERLRNVFLVPANLVYTLPSLALFVVIPSIIGTRILDQLNVVVALSLYSTALLIRPVVEALDSIEGPVVAAATAMGYRPFRRFISVQLPLAIPVLSAGVRVASVSNISLVTVGAIIGTGGLGVLFTDGFAREYFAPIIVGIVLVLILAFVMDLVLVGLRRTLAPWERAGRGKPA